MKVKDLVCKLLECHQNSEVYFVEPYDDRLRLPILYVNTVWEMKNNNTAQQITILES